MQFITKYKNIFIFLIITIVICSLCYYFYNLGKKTEYNITNQNIKALTGQIQTWKNKYDEIVFVKASLSLEYNELKLVNSDLAERIKDSENKVITLNKLYLQYFKNYEDALIDYVSLSKIYELEKLNIKDTIFSKFLNQKYPMYNIDWCLTNKSEENINFDINGQTFFNARIDTIKKANKEDSIKITMFNPCTKLKSMSLNIKLYSGVEYDKTEKVYKSVVYCKDPNIKFNIDGYIDQKLFYPEQKRFHIGPYIGIGIGIPFASEKIQIPNLNFGIGITYSIFSF